MGATLTRRSKLFIVEQFSETLSVVETGRISIVVEVRVI